MIVTFVIGNRGEETQRRNIKETERKDKGEMTEGNS
jgi:hypothetical protein